MSNLKFDNNLLWNNLHVWNHKVGRATTRPVLLLWFIMRNPQTPRKDKLVIFASVAYLILPIDILNAKRMPIIGWLDEVTSLAVLVQKMSKHITPEIEARADEQLDKWFPEYVEYEMMNDNGI